MSNALSPNSTLNELFDEIRPDIGTRVVPVSFGKREDGKLDMMIAISGSEDEANVIMANLMHYVDEMQQVAEQKAADNKVVGMDGKPVDDEPTIILP